MNLLRIICIDPDPNQFAWFRIKGGEAWIRIRIRILKCKMKGQIRIRINETDPWPPHFPILFSFCSFLFCDLLYEEC